MEEKITNLIKNPVEEAGYILVKVIYEKENGNNFLRIFIDKKQEYINVNDCITVNNLLDPLLDQMDFLNDAYIVDVCSFEKGRE